MATWEEEVRALRAHERALNQSAEPQQQTVTPKPKTAPFNYWGTFGAEDPEVAGGYLSRTTGRYMPEAGVEDFDQDDWEQVAGDPTLKGQRRPFLSDQQLDPQYAGDPSMTRNVLEALLGGGTDWLWSGNKRQLKELGQARFREVTGQEIGERRDAWRTAADEDKWRYETFSPSQYSQLNELAHQLQAENPLPQPAVPQGRQYMADIGGRPTQVTVDRGGDATWKTKDQFSAGQELDIDTIHASRRDWTKQVSTQEGEDELVQKYREAWPYDVYLDPNLSEAQLAQVLSNSRGNTALQKELLGYLNSFKGATPHDKRNPEGWEEARGIARDQWTRLFRQSRPSGITPGNNDLPRGEPWLPSSQYPVVPGNEVGLSSQPPNASHEYQGRRLPDGFLQTSHDPVLAAQAQGDSQRDQEIGSRYQAIQQGLQPQAPWGPDPVTMAGQGIARGVEGLAGAASSQLEDMYGEHGFFGTLGRGWDQQRAYGRLDEEYGKNPPVGTPLWLQKNREWIRIADAEGWPISDDLRERVMAYGSE